MKTLSDYYRSVSDSLNKPIDSSSLGAFRVFFGMLMLWTTLKYFYYGWIHTMYLEPKFLFPFELLPWVKPWPGNGLYFHFGIMAVSALFLGLGLFYRISSWIFFLTYTYVFLLDQSVYNNHYYFICLVAFLLCLVRADRWMSLDLLINKKIKNNSETKTIPYWHLLIIKCQVFIVYFYGGIAKLNPDWFKGEPMRHWLKKWAGRENIPDFMARFFDSEFGAYFFSYGGLIFDLCIGFILIYRKTRLLGFSLILIFNLTNSWFFNIGVFPFLMIAATILFFEPSTPRAIVQKWFSNSPLRNIEINKASSQNNSKAVIFVLVYLAIQLLLPFRHWLYDGNVNWTEEGRTFAWHMKTASKTDCRLGVLATNKSTNETWQISAEGYLLFRQFNMMCIRPNMILQYVHLLKSELQKEGINDPIIKVRTQISFNYRPPQPIIDPNVNLASADYSIFKSADWILTLKE